MEETRLELRIQNEERMAEYIRSSQLCFKINNTMPHTEEYQKLIKELFGSAYANRLTHLAINFFDELNYSGSRFP